MALHFRDELLGLVGFGVDAFVWHVVCNLVDDRLQFEFQKIEKATFLGFLT